MSKFKICGCYYNNNKGKRCSGVYILNRKTNTFTIINKNLEKEENVTGIITCEHSIGNIFMDII